MIKILSLTYESSESGGPYSVSVNQKEVLDKNFFYLKLSYLKINIIYQYFFNKNNLKKFINKFDLIHIHNFFSIKSILILKISQSLAIPSVLSLHGNLNLWSMSNKPIRKFFFLHFFKGIINSTNLIHFLNKSEKDESSQLIGLNKIPNFIMPNCIDVSKYKITRNNNPLFTVLFFGRIDDKKNYLMIPDIVNLFKENNMNNVKFIIVGPKTKKNFNLLKSKIKELHIEHFIEIRNPIYSFVEKNNLFEEVDVFILPSKDEGDSVAIKEALASGKPVIISKECKLHYNEVNNKFIKIIEEYSILNYYKELVWYYNHPEEIKPLREKAQFYARNNFSNNLIKKKLPAIYLDCINHLCEYKNYN